ncbi:probable allantoicase [Camponotus floridanus]|uniref:probable allantoicase n=1 Tax=Camponotus floridanus TaxID=104421 RepID=UPI000DC6C4CC|nr:probable allantoicase [Camponotus floridanus]
MNNPAELYELSSETNGARILFSSDDFFGVAENLLQVTEPDIDIENMPCRLPQDVWITRRKRVQNCDFVIIQLAVRAEICFICVDTANLFNNAALKFSVQATNLSIEHDYSELYQNRSNRVGGHTTDEEWSNINQFRSETWPYLISRQPLNPGYPSMNKKLFMIPSTGQEYTHLRLNIYPDGGISRLRVYGKVLRPTLMPPPWNSCIDLVSKIYGGKCIAHSNCYNNSHPNNLITPMFSQDGWQTARSLIRSIEGFPHNDSSFNFNQIIGEEWAIFQLGYCGKIVSIELDTTGFKGDSPYAVQVQGLREGATLNVLNENSINNASWQDIIPYTLVNEGSKQEITVQDQNMKMAYVKLLIKPDGCVTGFRVLGEI